MKLESMTEMANPQKGSFPVFISYAHKDNLDADISKRWFDRLMEFLQPLVERNLVKAWSDRELEIGSDWHDRIQSSLESAKAAVLLISPAYLASRYIQNKELPVLLKNAKNKGVCIIPLNLRETLIQEITFKYPDPVDGPEEFSLSSLQSVNPPDRPLNDLTEPQQDKVFLTLARRLLELSQPSVRTEDYPAAQASPADRLPGSLKQASKFKSALEVLINLMTLPGVRRAVIGFQRDFEAASIQIDKLSAYKDLHDWLHALQYQCYDRIVNEASRFPGDETIRANFIAYEAILRKIVRSINRVAGQGKFSQINTQLLQQDIGEAWEELKQALQALSGERLNHATFLLFKLLNCYPAEINIRLTEVAGALPLAGIVKAMTVISKRLNSSELDLEKIHEFLLGVEALDNLRCQLGGLVDEHNRWQRIDSEIRWIRIDSGDFLKNLQYHWPRIRTLTEPLYSNNDADWAEDLRDDCEDLTLALASQGFDNAAPAAGLKDVFWRYRWAESMRFFEVDVNLKNLCSNLLLVGQPLNTLLRLIGNSEDNEDIYD